MNEYSFRTLFFLFTFALCFNSSVRVLANDSILVSEVEEHRYDKRIHRYQANWMRIMPTQMVAQYAGNMGFLSLGMGWSYGKRNQWETQLMVGFLPRYSSKRAKMTITIKQNYIPWSVAVRRGWHFEPFECGLYINTVYGEEFWNVQPQKYPRRYYMFSTKLRPNIFVGERFTKVIPRNHRKWVKSCTFFYEFSSPDIYVLEYFKNSYLKLNDVLSMSLGLKLQIL